MGKTATYPVTPAQIGNSRGYRVDAALFRDHPELREGNFEAAVIGAGVFLVRQLRELTPDEHLVVPIVILFLAYGFWQTAKLARARGWLR